MRSRLPRFRYAFIFTSVLLVSSALADVTYKVTAHPETQKLSVEMTFPRKQFDTDLQMPNWGPGGYILANFGKGVNDLHITDDTGRDLPITKPNDYTWRVSGASAATLTAKYDVNATYSDRSMHYSGPSTYLYLVNRKTEPCVLDLETPEKWRIAIGLLPDKKSPHTFRAKTYDVLADNPVTMGDFLEEHYVVNGKDHELALRGEAKSDIDMQHLLKATAFVSTMEGDFFGDVPYDRYVWHFSVNDRADGAGGLEHLSSTQIGLSSGVGPRAVTVLAHEFFHLWNVKRIRSSALGPFDYTQLPQTGALWWLEGVTDYYSHFLLHRYGWWSDGDLYDDIVRNVDGVRANEHRMEISPYQSSYRVRESNNGKGNSNGLLVSYYNTGWVLGMVLDIEIRTQSGGKHSLDDVEHTLWKECKNDQPGFPEDEIRTQCIKFGGPSLGAFYDKYVMQPGELPVEDELAKIGLTWSQIQQTSPSFGFAYQGSKASGGARVGTADPTSPVKSGDLITEIDGTSLGGHTAAQIQKLLDAAVKRSAPGKNVHFKLTRKDAGTDTVLEVDVNPSVVTKTVHVVEPSATATAEQIRLREGWYWGTHKRPATIEGP